MPEELMHKHFAPFVVKKGEEYMSERQRAHFRNILQTLKAELMNDIENQAAGLFFAGHYRDGVSLGDSILSGCNIVERVGSFLTVK